MSILPLNATQREILKKSLDEVGFGFMVTDVEKVIAGEATPFEIVQLVKVVAQTSELRGLATAAGEAISRLLPPENRDVTCPYCNETFHATTGIVNRCPRCSLGIIPSRRLR